MELDRLKDIRLRGIGKLLHVMVMIITYPLRHFFKFLAFLIVFVVILAAIPMIQGVRYTDIPDWYLLRYERKKPESASVSEQQVVSQPVNVTVDIKEVEAPKIIRKEPATAPAVKHGPGLRQAFIQAVPEEKIAVPRRQYPVMNMKPGAEHRRPPAEKNFSASAHRPAGIGPEEKHGNIDLPRPENNLHYRKDESLPLVYEDNPQKVSGKTFVFSANEMSVGDTYIILYGVYTDPRKYSQNKAHEYVKELVDGKMLECYVVAYTYQNMATGICFLDGRNINQNLVDAGFADNIAL